MNFQALKMYSQAMRELIKFHASQASIFVHEMMADDPFEYEVYTVKMLTETLANTTIQFVAQDLDPDDGDLACVPKEMQAAIGEFVEENFKVSFKLG